MTPGTDARRRNRRVLIEIRMPDGQAANGEPKVVWEAAWKDAADAPIYLSAEKLEGRALERFAAAERLATTAAVFACAWAPANQIDPATHRLTYEGRRYEVTGSVEIGTRQGVAVICEAIASTPGGKAGPS